MRSGRLRARIEIHKPVDTDDGHGGFLESWQLDFKRWAELEHVSGSVSFNENKQQAKAGFTATIRADSQTRLITSQHRIKKGNKFFSVTAPPRERTPQARELVIYLEELV